MDDDKVAALANYYLREGFKDSVVQAADILLGRTRDSAYLECWKGFALFKIGSISQVRHGAITGCSSA